MATTNEGKELVYTGMDIFDVFKNDHKTMNKMLEELDKAPLEEKEGLFSKVDTEIMKHADCEERFFYPQLHIYEDMTEFVRNAVADHNDMREILQRMENEPVGSGIWQTECEILQETLADHVAMEEQEIFPRALRQMPGIELNRIREQVMSEKEKSPQPYRHRDVAPRRAGR